MAKRKLQWQNETGKTKNVENMSKQLFFLDLVLILTFSIPPNVVQIECGKLHKISTCIEQNATCDKM